MENGESFKEFKKTVTEELDDFEKELTKRRKKSNAIVKNVKEIETSLQKKDEPISSDHEEKYHSDEAPLVEKPLSSKRV